MKTIVIASIIALFCLFPCVGCRDTASDSPGGLLSGQEETDAQILPDEGNPTVQEKPASDIPPEKPLEDDEPLLISFEGGALSARIENGRVDLFIDHDIWIERIGIEELDSDAYYEFWDGPIPVKGLGGKAVAACIAQIQSLDYLKFTSFISPSVIILMEDGTLEMVLADPYTQGENSYFDSRKIPWLKDIVSLSYEVDPHSDYGHEMTVIAADSQGQRFNVRIPGSYAHIMGTELYCLRPPINEYDTDGDYLTLVLSEDGAAVFRKYFGGYDELYEMHYGSYDIQLPEPAGAGMPAAGTLSFDLNLDWWIWEAGEGGLSDEDAAFWDAGLRLDGRYMTWIDNSWLEGSSLHMTYFDGGGLLIYRDNRAPDDYFVFYSYDWKIFE